MLLRRPARRTVKLGAIHTCRNCSRGTYNNVSGQLSCTPCPQGWYGDEVALNECKQCIAGRYNSEFESIDESLALSVHQGDSARKRSSFKRGMQACEAGFFNTFVGQVRCLTCPSGRYATPRWCPQPGAENAFWSIYCGQWYNYKLLNQNGIVKTAVWVTLQQVALHLSASIVPWLLAVPRIAIAGALAGTNSTRRE